MLYVIVLLAIKMTFSGHEEIDVEIAVIATGDAKVAAADSVVVVNGDVGGLQVKSVYSYVCPNLISSWQCRGITPRWASTRRED